MKNCPPKPTNIDGFFLESQKVITVLLATYTFVFIGCGSIYMENRGEITFVAVALAWGAVVTANIYTFGHISGAHINPAVTFAYAVTGQFPWIQVPFYVLGELLGSIFASLTLKWIFDGYDHKVMLTQPVGPNPASDLKVLVLEIIITFIYTLTNCSSRADPRAFKELGGVAVGVTVFFLALFAGWVIKIYLRASGTFVGKYGEITGLNFRKITGASMNPARTLGPAIIAWNFHKVWIYIIAPIIGAVSATTLYFFYLMPPKFKCESKQEDTSFFYLDNMNQVFTNDVVEISVISNNLGEKSAEVELH